jgi:hypothetical protein
MPRPRKKLPAEIEKDIRDLAKDGLGAAQIYAYIQRKYGKDPALRDAAESLDYKTVLRRARECGPPDDSEPWTLTSATPEEASVVMPVLGAALAQKAALLALNDPLLSAVVHSRRLTIGLAKWIVKVAAAAPSLPADWVYDIAREYRAWELQAAQGTPRPYLTDPATLDAFLACRPWESEEAAERYERLLQLGIVKQPMYLGTWWRNILEREQLRRKLQAVRPEIGQQKE